MSLAFKSRHGWFTNSCLEPYLVQNILFSEITYLLSFNRYGIFSGIPGDNNQYYTQKSSTLCPALAVSRTVLYRSPLRGYLLEEFSTFISTFLCSNFLVINMQNLKRQVCFLYAQLMFLSYITSHIVLSLENYWVKYQRRRPSILVAIGTHTCECNKYWDMKGKKVAGYTVVHIMYFT